MIAIPAANKSGRMAGYAIVYFYPGKNELLLVAHLYSFRTFTITVASPFYYCAFQMAASIPGY